MWIAANPASVVMQSRPGSASQNGQRMVMGFTVTTRGIELFTHRSWYPLFIPQRQPEVCTMAYTSAMTDANRAIAKLQRIQQLWVELGRTKVKSHEYQNIMIKLRALSAEYQAFVAAPQMGKKSK